MGAAAVRAGVVFFLRGSFSQTGIGFRSFALAAGLHATEGEGAWLGSAIRAFDALSASGGDGQRMLLRSISRTVPLSSGSDMVVDLLMEAA
jgi:hypothetical protein